MKFAFYLLTLSVGLAMCLSLPDVSVVGSNKLNPDDTPSPSPTPARMRLLPDFKTVRYPQRREQLRRPPKFSRQADTDEMMDHLLHIQRHAGLK
jgi:hypothetical protein